MDTATKIQTDAWLRDALPRGTALFGYEIAGILGRGGFGITYRAVNRIDQVFAIKECYPKQFVVRQGDDVLPAGDEDADIVATLLDRFTREARALTLFSKSGMAGDGVVKVITFFEANHTAYIVMEFLEGESLETLIAAHPEGLPEEILLPIMQSILTALGCVHDHGILHRDIKPANILLRRDGRPVLLDFGAARGIQSASPVTSLAIFTESYAPIEQVANQAQGPFSDLYSFGVTCYHAIAGARFREAPKATERAAKAYRDADPLIPAVKMGAGRYSDALLRSIDLLLRVKPEDRPQSVAEFLREFRWGPQNDVTPADDATRLLDPEATRIDLRHLSQPSETGADVTVFQRDPPAVPPPKQNLRATASTVTTTSPHKAARPSWGARLLVVLSVGMVFAGVLGGGAYLYTKSIEPPKTAAVATPEPLVQAAIAPPVAVRRAPDPPPSVAAPAAPPGLPEANKAYDQKDYAEAARDYLAAAGKNDAQAQYQLGHMYQLGQGLTQDYAAAAHWYALAAAQGHKEAELQLGNLAQNGLGIPKNYATALHWYQLAAAQGSAPAQNQLGYLYQMGYGVPVNYAEALRWYQSAAGQGSAAAQFRIGHFYEEGLGVPKDLVAARDWISRAAASGSPEAKRWLTAH